MFQKGRERRQGRREDRKERREERKESRGDRKDNHTGLKVAAGAAAVGVGAAVIHNRRKNKAKKEASSEAATYYSSGDESLSSDSDLDDGFEIKHPVEYTVLEVQYFLMAIGLVRTIIGNNALLHCPTNSNGGGVGASS